MDGDKLRQMSKFELSELVLMHQKKEERLEAILQKLEDDNKLLVKKILAWEQCELDVKFNSNVRCFQLCMRIPEEFAVSDSFCAEHTADMLTKRIHHHISQINEGAKGDPNVRTEL